MTFPTTSTPLVGGNTARENTRVTFSDYIPSVYLGSCECRQETKTDGGDDPFEYEQAWSAQLPLGRGIFNSCSWAPSSSYYPPQVCLMLVDAMNQTSNDGSNPLTVYILIVIATTLAILPLTPFIHRSHTPYSRLPAGCFRRYLDL